MSCQRRQRHSNGWAFLLYHSTQKSHVSTTSHKKLLSCRDGEFPTIFCLVQTLSYTDNKCKWAKWMISYYLGWKGLKAMPPFLGISSHQLTSGHQFKLNYNRNIKLFWHQLVNFNTILMLMTQSSIRFHSSRTWFPTRLSLLQLHFGGPQVNISEQLATNSEVPTNPQVWFARTTHRTLESTILIITVLLERIQIRTSQMKIHIGQGLEGSWTQSFHALSS